MGSPATDATPAVTPPVPASDSPGADAAGLPTVASNSGRSLAHLMTNRLRRLAYGVFYLFPPRMRQRVVRLLIGRYGIGAVALVRDAERPDRLLLLRTPRSVGWSLPGGVLRRGEHPVDGCVRELVEETGIALTADEIIPAVPNAIIRTSVRWVDTVFEASVPASTVTLRPDGLETVEAAWHPVENLPPLTIATARLLSYYGIGPYADYPEIRA